MALCVFCSALHVVVWAGETLENDALRLRFAGAEDGYSIAAIENRLVGNTRFVNPAPGQAGFWRLDFVYKGAAGTNEHVFVDNLASAAARNAERTAKGMRFTWRGVDVADEKGILDVFAEVDLPQGDAASEWRLSVSNRSCAAALYATSYPCLRELTKIGEGDVLIPTGNLGASLRKNYKFWDGGKRDNVSAMPGWHPPVTAFNLGEAGLYIAAHDPDLRYKKLVVQADHGARFDTVVENAGFVGKAAEGPRYAVTVAAYRGDWWQAAKLYRDWALRQKWARKGPIAKRQDYPKSLADTDLLFRFNERNPQVMSNNVVALKRLYPDLNLAIHWYCWSEQPYCVNFPEFFPALPGVKGTVAFAKRNGVKMIPYVDPRLWDMDLASWAYAMHGACRDMEGNPSVEVYYSKHRLAVMCPTSEAWRETAMKMTTDAIMSPSESINGCGFDGVYHDQVACSRQIPCWVASHEHPKGGGHWWADGYRRAFDAIHDWCAKRGAMVLSEGTGDMCLDQIDGFLKASWPYECEVPFYPAVYAGYAVYYGNYQSLRDDIASFRAYQMRDFTRGVLLGWLDRYNVTSPEFTEKQKLLGMLARVRRTAAEFMIYGTLEDEVRFTDAPPPEEFEIKALWRDTKRIFTLPTVMGTVWRNLEKTATALIVANATDKPHTVRFRLPAHGFALQRISGMEDAAYREENDVGVITLPPSVAVCLKTSN